MKKTILLTTVFLLAAGLIWAGGKQEQVTTAGSSQIAPEEENWNEIYAAAKEEGKVVIYSLSSRIFDAVEGFKVKYPGIEVEAIDMPDVEQIDKITREQDAGIYNADVLFLANGTTLLNELLPKGYVKNYVPSSLEDGVYTKDVIADDFRQPLLVHSMESKVVFYNTQTYPKPPVDNLWDLTRERWRGKVQMKDPMLTEENLNMLQTIVQHSDEMAVAYEKEFGEPIKLSPGVENAGFEFIKRLVENDIVLTSSDGDAAKAVGAPDQDDPPLTLSVASSKLRYNDTKGTKLGIAWEMEPKVGITKNNHLVIAANAPHPNAAKLLIRWLLGDSEGEAGMEPFNVPGGFASRRDVEPMADISLDDLRRYTWFIDYEYVYKYGLSVRDFWLGL
ncbi:MAG: ABC transporter substrate-binding protein [Spirochaetes bacterium]|nr:MAG: ABC transporter substrate-binding protein [Spirochaetota bacterium]